MLPLLLGIGLPLFVVLIVMAVVLRRGLRLRLLVRDGVRVRGRVIERMRHTQRTYVSQKRLRYEYRESNGRRHEAVALVADVVWHSHPRGMPIDIVHARLKPWISAPAEVVEQAR